MAGLECLEDASDEALDMRACHRAYFEDQNNCTLPWRKELNPNHPECNTKLQGWSKRWWALGKVATDTNILDLHTRYRSKLGWIFWF